MIKRVILALLMLPAILIILITATAKRLMDDLNEDAINSVFEYLSGIDGMREVILSETGVIIVLYWMSQYSHWVITACVIWIAILAYILFSLRRSKRGKRKKKV